MSTLKISLDKIYVDPNFNVRNKITEISILDLKELIRVQGLLQPVCVRPNDETDLPYALVYGFRRFASCKSLGFKEIECIVKEMTNIEAIEANIVENMGRKDLTMTEEAKGVKKLLDNGKHINEIGKLLGQATSWIETRMKLLELPKDIQQVCADYFFTGTQVKNIHKYLKKPEKMYTLCKMYKENKQKAGKFDKKELKRIEESERQRLKSPLKKKKIGAEDLRDTANYIATNVGGNIASAALLFAAGDLSEYDLHSEIAHNFEDYVIPEHISMAING